MPTEPAIYICPVLHPAFLLRGKWSLEPAQILYLRRAADIAYGSEEPELPDIWAGPAGAIYRPTQSDLAAFARDPGIEQGVAVDIENGGPYLRLVGLCRIADLRSVSIWFRKQGGEPCFSHLEVEWLDQLLMNPTVPKVFHNGQGHDVPYLEELGFRVVNYFDDTMLMQHVAYPEMPKDLGYISVLYGRLTQWKHMIRSQAEEGK